VGAGLVAAEKKRRYPEEKYNSFLSMGDNEDANKDKTYNSMSNGGNCFRQLT